MLVRAGKLLQDQVMTGEGQESEWEGGGKSPLAPGKREFRVWETSRVGGGAASSEPVGK